MECTEYLLDTCICIFLMRGKHDIGQRIEQVGLQNCYISEITVAELLFGAVWSGNAGNLELVKRFCKSINVLPIGNTLMEYSLQKARLRSKGLLIDDFDLLIGCCAICNGMKLVTDNLKHFERLPLEIENWIPR